MSSLSKGLNNRLKAEPRQFCKIEKIFVYASGFQLRNKVLAQALQQEPKGYGGIQRSVVSSGFC